MGIGRMIWGLNQQRLGTGGLLPQIQHQMVVLRAQHFSIFGKIHGNSKGWSGLFPLVPASDVELWDSSKQPLGYLCLPPWF